MWIVRLALRRPYTFVVMALAIILLFPVVLLRTPVDIFPDINIPVISLVWTYTGLQPQEMEQRITSNVERGVQTLVNDVEHIESQSFNGIAVIKVFFQPGANIQTSLAQVTAISQTFLRFLPPGTTPPLVIIFSISATILSARNWRPYRAPPRPFLMEASSGSSASILIRRNSRPRGFLRLTS